MGQQPLVYGNPTLLKKINTFVFFSFISVFHFLFNFASAVFNRFLFSC